MEQPIQPYNNELVEELMASGHTYTEAVLIASTEMEGASTLENGDIHALQTHCNVLNYDESLTESKGMQEGRKATTEAVAIWLKENGFNSLNEYYQTLES